jgi:predicted dehydrogenase
MPKPLRALIHGSGFAGQGHAEALRDAGVEIAGMVSRTADVVRGVAQRMGIAYAGTDWQQALDALKPDIVAIGTPGGPHFDAVMPALAAGCHIYCDKPLAVTAAQAKAMYLAARKEGVRTAFAASFRYQPHALLAKELVRSGVIGEPWEAECVSHYNLNPLIPWGWSHNIALGGGRLANNFTHKLSIVEHVLGGTLISVNGEARNDMRRAPVAEGVHDFREREKFAPAAGDVAGVKWREVDSEWSYTVMARLTAGRPHFQPVSAVFKHGGLQPRLDSDYVAFYGSEGAIHITGSYAAGPLRIRKRGGEWEAVSLPASITSSVPEIKDDTQRNWTQLAREFVADIQGKGYSGYQTFREGWLYQEAIDAIRRGDGWFMLPPAP